MEFNEAFENAVKAVLNGYYKPNTICTVISVDKIKNTCNVKETGTEKEINNVRLLSIEANPIAKFVVYPKINSEVSIAFLFLASDEAQVVKYSETESILLNGDEFGGLVKAEELKTQLDKTNMVINAIAYTLQNWVVVPGDGGAALKAAIAPALAGKDLGSYSNIKNDKVKHG